MSSVVFKNGGWGAVDRATLAMYPQDYATRANTMPFTRPDLTPRHALVAEVCGVGGFTCTDPAALPGILDQSLAASHDAAPPRT